MYTLHKDHVIWQKKVRREKNTIYKHQQEHKDLFQMDRIEKSITRLDDYKMKKFYAMQLPKHTGAQTDSGINGIFGPLQRTQFSQAPPRPSTTLGGFRTMSSNQ